MFDMQDVLKRENVQIIDSIPTWEEAISYAVDPLVQSGYAQPCYIDNIIANAQKYGPYFVLCPDLALLHARPEQGAIKTQLGVTIVRQGTVFKEGATPCRVLVTLVATDGDTHIDVMRVLAMMFTNPENIQELALAQDPDQVYKSFMAAAEGVSID